MNNDENQLHQHCLNCFHQNCDDLFAKTCKMASCQTGCGAVLHECKMEDHLNICLNSIQPCNNSSYGCPFKLKKCDIGKHLTVCPASTVICTMEWNRKPLAPHNTIGMKNYNPNSAIQNHLEVGLALRDQRVLLETMLTKDILNSLFDDTLKFNKCIGVKTNDSINDFASDEYFLPGNIDSLADSLVAASIQTSVKKSEIMKKKKINEENNDKKPLLRKQFYIPPKKVFKDAACDTSDIAINFSNLKWLNPSVKRQGFDSTTDILEMFGAYEKQESVSYSHRSEGLLCTYDQARYCSFRHIASQTRPHFKINKQNKSVAKVFQENFENMPDKLFMSSHHNEKLYQSLALNQVMECLPRYEIKSRSVYSFMCNNLLRRDQFRSHFKNVHCDICSHLNGWLEEKCPYAQYGCNFIRNRFYPKSFPDSLIYDNARSCIAIRPQLSECEKNWKLCSKLTENCNLFSLPWEILEYILSFLDSYSIGQLSETCTYLKNVCFSILKQRGIVILKWNKVEFTDGSVTWLNVGEKWLFGNAFSEITEWTLNKQPGMCAHVSKCAFAAKHVTSYTDNVRIKLCG